MIDNRDCWEKGEMQMADYKIACIEGELQGKEIILKPNEKLVIGRDPKEANLVFRDITISRKHCLIEPGEEGSYYVTDYSSCGVITGEGVRLNKGKRKRFVRGTVLLMGKSGTKIKLE